MCIPCNTGFCNASICDDKNCVTMDSLIKEPTSATNLIDYCSFSRITSVPLPPSPPVPPSPATL